jgi:uncharacterized membrane protein
MEDLIKQLTSYLATGVEAVAGVLIAFAAIEATISAIKLFFREGHAPDGAKEALRLRLGRWLAVALEFELAADILRTAIAPTWSEIGQLAAIATLRTALNYFLQKEIDKAEARHPETPLGTPTREHSLQPVTERERENIRPPRGAAFDG